jgi:predicted nuclease of predicted toxin-antitoxin system
MENASDAEHLTFASEQERILVTCDKDFPQLHFQWMAAGREHAGIVYCREPDLCTISIIVENVLAIHADPAGKSALHNYLWRVTK